MTDEEVCLELIAAQHRSLATYRAKVKAHQVERSEMHERAVADRLIEYEARLRIVRTRAGVSA